MLFGEDGAYSSLHTEKPDALDMRPVKLRGATAKEKAKNFQADIERAVKDTQAVIVRALPDRLLISQKQYDTLTGYPQLLQIGDVGQEFWLYKTKYNVMDLEVRT